VPPTLLGERNRREMLLHHLDQRASDKANGGDAGGRLSAEGRWYLRSVDDSSSERAI
jgi:hypothetical protein